MSCAVPVTRLNQLNVHGLMDGTALNVRFRSCLLDYGCVLCWISCYEGSIGWKKLDSGSLPPVLSIGITFSRAQNLRWSAIRSHLGFQA